MYYWIRSGSCKEFWILQNYSDPVPGCYFYFLIIFLIIFQDVLDESGYPGPFRPTGRCGDHILGTLRGSQVREPVYSYFKFQ